MAKNKKTNIAVVSYTVGFSLDGPIVVNHILQYGDENNSPVPKEFRSNNPTKGHYKNQYNRCQHK